MRRELNLIAEFHRGRQLIRRLRYAKIDRALPRLTYWMMLDGKVGDVIEVHHAISKRQLGTIRMNAKGQLVSKFIWD